MKMICRQLGWKPFRSYLIIIVVDGVLPAESATFLEIQREVGRLQRLVQDLEEVHKAEAGQLPLDLETTAPAAFVQTAVKRLALHQPESETTATTTPLRVSTE
jgi:signal transduction histidine kinase